MIAKCIDNNGTIKLKLNKKYETNRVYNWLDDEWIDIIDESGDYGSYLANRFEIMEDE
ncbi:hypothetical protein HS141_12900 [Cetobacterium somerae]|uniref:hypothetical protein n=1 Tax=Cetobacterium somerae TaxID=188913 RepID=UPI00211DDA38|nr:hypothetical protein [Cetobacterium somerae]MCQ9627822.1 hypothetical protein [Cetobacterium somerae]